MQRSHRVMQPRHRPVGRRRGARRGRLRRRRAAATADHIGRTGGRCPDPGDDPHDTSGRRRGVDLTATTAAPARLPPAPAPADLPISPIVAELPDRVSAVPDVAPARAPRPAGRPRHRIDGSGSMTSGSKPTASSRFPMRPRSAGTGSDRRPVAGATVLAGHVSWNDTIGPFFRLADLEPGAEIQLDLADGTSRRYSVMERAQYPKLMLPQERIWTRDGNETLVLITCGGDFNRADSALHRQHRRVRRPGGEHQPGDAPCAGRPSCGGAVSSPDR